MNRMIRRKLIETEHQLDSIKQWCSRTIILDRNWRESRKEEERLRRERNNKTLTSKLNNQEIQGQILLRPQVWPRRQEIPQQIGPTRPALMKEVERMNMVITRSQQQDVGLYYSTYIL